MRSMKRRVGRAGARGGGRGVGAGSPERRLLRRFPARGRGAECGCRDPFREFDDRDAEEVLDVRGLPTPLQFGRTLRRMEDLPPGRRLRHVNAVVPWPLFAMLETRGYRYRLVDRVDGAVHVLVWPLAALAPSAVDPAAAAAG